MKKYYFLLIFCLSLGLNAQTLFIKSTCSVHSEYDEIDAESIKADGWIEKKNEYDETYYEIDFSVDEKHLPIAKYIGPMALTISKEALFSIGIVVGDSDSSSETELLLPRFDNKLLPIENLKIITHAGDAASGSWSFDCKTEISVKIN